MRMTADDDESDADASRTARPSRRQRAERPRAKHRPFDEAYWPHRAGEQPAGGRRRAGEDPDDTSSLNSGR